MLVQAALAFGASLVVALALANPLIAQLRASKFRQHAYEDAPKSHQSKTGTPTMGGLLFLIAPLVCLAFAHDAVTVAFAVLVFGSAAIGFVDDLSAIRADRNRGLRGRTKFVLTAVVGIAFLAILVATGSVSTAMLGLGLTPLWVWASLSLAVILATTHAVNLTDGLDGLASGTIVPPLLVLAFVAYRTGELRALVAIAAVLGAVVAFLAFNRHPARVFMGDTGSLALGAALAGAAILTGAQLLLPLIGGVFALETLSVILQVASYKTTKRRIFRMSPLHHHFELAGWPETTVTTRFWLASLGLSAIGLALVAKA
jgi:phospho-N-acetylmuramoyl-pentapeptide-transferase